MTIEEKDKARLVFKAVSMLLVLIVLLGGILLGVLGKIDGFIGIAGPVCTFAGIVFGVDYATSPTNNLHKRDTDKEFQRNF